MRTSKRLPAYRSVAMTDDTYFKLEVWRKELSKRWGRRATFSETVDYLLDQMGVPDDDE